MSSAHDAAIDAAALAAVTTLSPEAARHELAEIACQSEILKQAVAASVRRMGLAADHVTTRRIEYLRDRVHDRTLRCIVGIEGRPAILDLDQIADGVRFSTWLRRLIYPTMRQLEIDLIRIENARRKVVIAPIEEASNLVQPRSAPDAVIEGRDTEALWQMFLAERTSLRGSAALLTEAWYLTRTLGLKDLSHPRSEVDLRSLVGDLDASTVRARLRRLRDASPLGADALDCALRTMTSSYTEADFDALASTNDHVLTHLVKAALTPTPPLTLLELSSVRTKANQLIRPPGSSVPKSRTTKVRAVNTATRTWASWRAETHDVALDAPMKPAALRARERDEFERAAHALVDLGVDALGTSSDDVASSFDRLLHEFHLERRAGHTA